jgi:hypothetical protein
MAKLNRGLKASDDTRKPVRSIGAAMAVGILCAGLGGCVSDAEVPMTNVSQTDSNSPHLRYFGGPKSPMWPDR